MSQHQQHITLCMAVTQRDRMLATVELAAALGVNDFVPVITDRTQQTDVARFTAELDDYRAIVERTTAVAATAGDQPITRHATMPLADAVDALLADGATVIVLWQAATEPMLADLLRTLPEPPARIGLVVGPRTGLSPAEVASAVASGAYAASIGSGVVGNHVAAVAGVATARYLAAVGTATHDPARAGDG